MKAFTLFIFISLLPLSTVFAQRDSLQQQINSQVWKPFIENFSKDADGFMNVHSRNVSRVMQDDGVIQTYDQYYKATKDGLERGKKLNRKPALIELRFTQRIAANGKAMDVGYYKTTIVTPEGKMQSFYGKFHVLLQKENGVWKILMDADAREDASEQTFMTAKPM